MNRGASPRSGINPGRGTISPQTEVKLQPLLVNTGAGFSALRFDGAGDALALGKAIPLAGKSVFAVVKWDQVKAYSFALGLDAGTDGYLRMESGNSLLTGGRYRMLYQNGIASPKVGYTPGDGRFIFHKNLHSLLEWNVFAVTDNPPGNENLQFLGMNAFNNEATNRFAGEIAALLVYDHALPVKERLQVEEYLERQYLGWAAMTTMPVTDAAGRGSCCRPRCRMAAISR